MNRAGVACLAVVTVVVTTALGARAQVPERVVGGDGVELAVYEAGSPDAPPLLFIHGFLGNHLVWSRQFESALADEFRLVAFDLRGHGASDKPVTAGSYTDSGSWAEDLAAVIRGKGLTRPVLVGWSYGAYVIADYLRRHGDAEIAGIVIVAGTSALGTDEAAALLGEELFQVIDRVLSPQVAVSIEGTRSFLPMVTAEPMPEEVFQTMLAGAMMVPPVARQGMFSRTLDNTDVLRAVSVPALVVQGAADRIVRPRAARSIAETIADARLVLFEGVGHAPFMEDPSRFNSELARFVREVQADRSR